MTSCGMAAANTSGVKMNSVTREGLTPRPEKMMRGVTPSRAPIVSRTNGST